MQRIKLTYGVPCAFTDNKSHPASGNPEQVFYPLEKYGMEDSCQSFFTGPMAGTAVDNRYYGLLADIRQPTEYEIQKNSGVFDTLEDMPYFDKYVPDAQNTKESILYSLYGRPVLYFAANCENSIEKAIDLLEEIKEGDYEKYNDMNLVCWICAMCFFGIKLIFMVFNLLCYANRGCEDRCCGRKCCFHATKVIYASVALLFAISITVLTGITFGNNYDKYVNLNSWAGYSECVDDYMKIDIRDKNDLERLASCTVSLLAVSVMILGLDLYTFICMMCFCAKDRCG